MASRASTSDNTKRRRLTTGRYELFWSKDGDRFVAAEHIYDHLGEAMLHVEELVDIVRNMKGSYETLTKNEVVEDDPPTIETYWVLRTFAHCMEQRVAEEWKRFNATWELVDDRDAARDDTVPETESEEDEEDEEEDASPKTMK